MPRDVHGTTRLETGDDGETILVIVTDRKKGKKTEKYERKYILKNSNPDPKVAFPAFALEHVEGQPAHDTYHVSVREFGPSCDCPDGNFRRENDRTKCKHVKALQSLGLMPRDPDYGLPVPPEEEEPLPY